MSEPTKCGRCGTEGCPRKRIREVSDELSPEAFSVVIRADIACSLRLLARIQKAQLTPCDKHLEGMPRISSDCCPRGRFER